MKFSRGFIALGVLPIFHLAFARVTNGDDGWLSALRGGTTRFAGEDVADVGVAEVTAIAPGDEHVGEELIEELQADGETIGEIPCPPLSCTARRRGAQSIGGSNWHIV